MDDEADKSGDRRRQPDGRLVPMVLRQQVNAEIGAEAALDVGQEKIQPVERPPVRHRRLAAQGRTGADPVIDSHSIVD